QSGANPVEQPFAIGGEDADPGRAAVAVVFRDHARPRIPDMRFGGRDLLRVRGLPGKRLGQPVTVGKAPRMRAERARLPAQRGGELLPPGIDQRSPAMLLVPEPEPLLGCLEQGAWPDCAGRYPAAG